MKRLSAMLLAILMVLSLCACGSQGSSNVEVELPNNSKNGPSAVTIQKDITDELSRKNPYAVLTKIETVKSLTEDTSYEITLSVFAQTRYAEWIYEAEMSYTKYDQGWMMDHTEWNAEDYTVVHTPDVDGILEKIDQENTKQGNSNILLLAESAHIIHDTGASAESFDIYYTEKRTLKHALEFRDIKSTWHYDVDNDSWVVASNSTGYDTLNIEEEPYDVDFSGTWCFGDIMDIGGGGIISQNTQYAEDWLKAETTISNYTADSFDLYNASLGNDTIHVNRTGGYGPLFGNSVRYTDGNNLYVEFIFKNDCTYIRIHSGDSFPGDYQLLADAAIIVDLPPLTD